MNGFWRSVAFFFAISTAPSLMASETYEARSTSSPFHERRMTPAEAEVWKVVEEWNDAFATNDVDKFFSFVDESIVLLTPSNPYRVEGKIDDRAEFEFGLKMGYSRLGYFEEIAPIVRVYGDVAVATYFNRGFYGPETSGQMIYLKETDVLRRENGQWKLVHIHISK